MTVEDVVGQRCGLVSGPEESNFEIPIFDLLEDFLDSFEVGAFDLSLANSFVVDWS